MNIYEWRDLERKPLRTSQLPAVNFRDTIEEITAITYGYELRAMTVMLEIAVVESSDAPSEIRSVLADLEVSIDSDRTWGGLAIDSELIMNEMEIEHLESKIMVARIPLKISFKTVEGNPYSQ